MTGRAAIQMRALPLLLLFACSAEETSPDDPFREARPSPERPDADAPPAVAPCDGLACLPCGQGRGCGEGEPIEGTCCVPGDPLERLGAAFASEVVDLQTDGTFSFACGGFGATIHDVTDPTHPVSVGGATSRCQHAQPGPMVGDSRVVFFAHHGDSYAGGARLTTYLVGEGPPAEIDIIRDRDVLFEGMAFHDGHLYVAVHQGGLRVYRVSAEGHPELLSTLGGLGNAWKVEVADALAYVVDNDLGLHVVDISDPADPVHAGTVLTHGAPRDLAIDGDRLYVALGGLGVDVFDASDPAAPTPLANIETLGSAQSVAAGDGVLAVGAWSHVAVYDTRDHRLLATQRTRPRDEFEQDTAVALIGSTVLVGEWEGLHTFGYRPGRVAPDLWLEQDLYSFSPERADAQAVVVRNVGHRPLAVGLAVNDAALRLDTADLAVEPGGGAVAELTFTPPSTEGFARLVLTTNDPDEPEASLLVVAANSTRIDVGDRLDETFAFLDPSGANQIAGLEGNVVVLAYFALF